jgi:putative ATPase
VGQGGWIRYAVQEGRPLSILLWGPPGCGKTTLARLYAQAFQGRFVPFSALFNGVADLKKLVTDIRERPLLHERTILFVDEIHRFNRAQQDAFLPFLEDGTLILVGATTENPSFALNNALLSRLRVLQVHALEPAALERILQRYEALSSKLRLTPEARNALIHLSQGDGRHLLNLVEGLPSSGEEMSLEELERHVQRRSPLYDKGEEGHYNLISALHKAVRGSDPDAALYWLARMLAGGEDPQFLARRIVRMASEDVGLADPQALEIALSAWRAYDQLGPPEGELALAQAIVYLSLAPKSNALYKALQGAQERARETSHLSPPKIILNAPTAFMKGLGYGKGYLYDHDTPEGFSGQHYFPEGLPRERYYRPAPRGFEREMQKRVAYFEKLRQRSELLNDAAHEGG